MPAKDDGIDPSLLTGSLVPEDRKSQMLLEDEADRILFELMVTITRPSEKDILTPWRLQKIQKREVLVGGDARHGPAAWVTESYGPDRALRQGIYGRAYNPVQTWLNSREPVRVGAPRPRGPIRPVSTSPFLWPERDGIKWPVTVKRVDPKTLSKRSRLRSKR